MTIEIVRTNVSRTPGKKDLPFLAYSPGSNTDIMIVFIDNLNNKLRGVSICRGTTFTFDDEDISLFTQIPGEIIIRNTK